MRRARRRNVLTGSDADEQFNANGGFDLVTSGGGADQFVFTVEGQRDVLTIPDFDLEADTLDLGGAAVANAVETPTRTLLLFDGDEGDAEIRSRTEMQVMVTK